MKKKLKKENRFLYWALAVSWMFFIFFLSDQPGNPSPAPSWQYFLLRKIAHIGEYSILAIFLLGNLSLTWKKEQALGAAFLWAFLFSLSDEWHQTFVANRSGNLVDVGIDLLGIVLGLGIYLVFKKYSIRVERKKIKQQRV